MVQSALTVTESSVTEEDLWHKRLSHISGKGLQELAKQGLLPHGTGNNLTFCEFCVVGKAKRQSFAKAQHSTKEILQYVHSDLWGPASNASLSGSRYFLTLIDDFSRKSWIFFLKTKDQAFEKFKE